MIEMWMTTLIAFAAIALVVWATDALTGDYIYEVMADYFHRR